MSIECCLFAAFKRLPHILIDVCLCGFTYGRKQIIRSYVVRKIQFLLLSEVPKRLLKHKNNILLLVRISSNDCKVNEMITCRFSSRQNGLAHLQKARSRLIGHFYVFVFWSGRDLQRSRRFSIPIQLG